MSLITGLLAGAVGVEMASLVNGVIEKHGDMQGLVNQFEQQGLGATIKSWVGSGENHAITPDQVHQAVGAETIKDLATKAGVSATELANKLALVLPQPVDKTTPNGTISTH